MLLALIELTTYRAPQIVQPTVIPTTRYHLYIPYMVPEETKEYNYLLAINAFNMNNRTVTDILQMTYFRFSQINTT